MIWLMVILLGVLQGITEFLPVSSSGHLRLLSEAFGVKDPQTFLDIMLHVGTLAAVLIVYRALFWKMLVAIGGALRNPGEIGRRYHEDPDLRLFLLACIATVPTALIAILLGDTFEAASANIAVVGVALIINGGILLVLRALTIGRWAVTAAQPRRPLSEIRLRDALIIGTAQGFGIFRGISRSGSTITTGLLTGLQQEASAAFSFVLSVPAICGAVVLKVKDAPLSGDALGMALVGAAVAAVVGTIALLVLLRMLRRGHLHHFAWYCFALGAIALGLAMMGET